MIPVSPVASRPSPSPPPWPSTPRPRRSRPPASRSSASAPASPTSRRPQHIVDAAIEACANPANHRYSPTAGLPDLRRAIADKTARDSGYGVHPEPGARHQRRQARRLQHVPDPARPRRRGPAARARTGPPIPRRSRWPAGRRSCCPRPPSHRLPGDGRPARGGADLEHQGAALRLAVEPDRRGVPAGGGRGDRPLGGRARHLGRHRRDLRAPHVRRPRVHVDARRRPRARRAVRRAERRRQDLRDDRVAGRLDDRSRGRDRRGHQPAVALDVERRQRRRSVPRSPPSPATSRRSR